MEDTLLSKFVRIGMVVCLYWTVSISMVFVNKSILGGAGIGNKDAPFFVTFFQCFITVLCCVSVSHLSKHFPRVFTAPPTIFELETAKKVLPLTAVFVSMITFNNLCLKYVGVSFYYVGRSLTTVFNVLLSYAILGQLTSRKAAGCCAIIVAGFWLGVEQESDQATFSWSGILFGIAASITVALNSIFTKKVLPVVESSIWLLSFYNNVLACALFVPLIVIFGEIPKIFLLISDGDLTFWMLMVVSGFFGFAIGYVTSLQIKVTSPLTHNVSGTAKACAQTVISTWWYTESKSGLWWLSNWVVLGGSMAYSYVKAIEMKAVPLLPTTITPEKEPMWEDEENNDEK